MATAVGNAKLPVTQNRIGKLKKRINQIKIGGQKKDPRKPQRVFEDEGSQVPKYVNRKPSLKSTKWHPQVPPRQPLRNIQPNVTDYHHGYVDNAAADPARRHADPYHVTKPDRYDTTRGSQQLRSFAPYRQFTVDYGQSDYPVDWAAPSEHAFYYDDERYAEHERKAVGVVPPCPIGESEIDMQSLGESIGEIGLPPNVTSRRYDPMDDWYMPDEYRDDVIDYVMEQDRMYTVKSVKYLYQSDIHPNMRTILIDWLIQVQVHQDLLDETLHLTVALIDRYHSQHIISLPKYQLLGVGCLFIAAKYCERFPPLIVDLVKLTENTYTRDHLLNMELKILAVLQFDMTFIDPHTLLERYLHAFGDHNDEKVPYGVDASRPVRRVRYLSMYMLDLSLVEHRCIVFRRAQLVLNVVCLAKMILDKSTQYQLMPHCKHEILVTLAYMLVKTETAEQTAAKVKYSSASRYNGISLHSYISQNSIVTSLAKEITSYPLPQEKHVRHV